MLGELLTQPPEPGTYAVENHGAKAPHSHARCSPGETNQTIERYWFVMLILETLRLIPVMERSSLLVWFRRASIES